MRLNKRLAIFLTCTFSDVGRTRYGKERGTCSMQYSAYNVQRTEYSVQGTGYTMRRTTYEYEVRE
jgi:hypothetical protein